MRNILVTGANKGIGLALVKAILHAHSDTFVLLGTRNRERGEDALAHIAQEQSAFRARCSLLELDVSDDSSVERAAQAVGRQFEGRATPLYGIVNNAGIGLGSHNLRAVLEVNTFGIHRVCQSFLPLLDPEQGRIVNITSASGPNFVARCTTERKRFFVDDTTSWEALQGLLEKCLAAPEDQEAFADLGLGSTDAYGLSKACANTYTQLLARKHPALRIHACTPGYIATDMTRPAADKQGKPPEALGMKPPEEGTRSAMFLLFDEPEGNGRYYGSDALRSPLDCYRAPGSHAYTGE